MLGMAPRNELLERFLEEYRMNNYRHFSEFYSS